ncbi:MAG: hypothetical protein HY909_11775 [Deltaproteobacteria bacterium]|nr:hypothetical protein [Deltaproteobacteria bacterium]
MRPRAPTPAALAALALLAAGSAGAQVTVRARPVFSERCLARTQPSELIARVDHNTDEALRGTLAVDPLEGPRTYVRTRRAVALTVPAHGHATVRVSTAVPATSPDLVLRVLDDRGRELAREPLAFTEGADRVLVDATPGARLATHLNAESSPVVPGSPSLPAPSPEGELVACAAARSPDTGELVLPERPEGYRNVRLVLLDTASLTTLPLRARVALADYVLSGGALALLVDHRDDLRHPVAQAFLGQGLTPTQPRLAPSQPVIRYYRGYQAEPEPRPVTLANATAFRGGNLHTRDLSTLHPNQLPELLGSTAEYGQGKVHLLSWNPTRAPALEDPWSSRCLTRSAALSAPGAATRVLSEAPDTLPVPDAVRALLASRGPFRPGVGLGAAGALGALLVVVGALRLGARRPGAALAAALALATLGASLEARLAGSLRRREAVTRSVGMIDLTAGFSRGTVRRFTAYDGPGGELGTLSRGGRGLGLVLDPSAGTGVVSVVEAREEVRLVGARALPWVPLVVREEGLETLPGSVALLPEGSDIIVVNHLPVTLEEVVLSAPSLGARRLQRLRPGGRWTVSWAPTLPPELQSVFLGDASEALQPFGMQSSEALLVAPDADPGRRLQQAFRRAPDHGAWWRAALSLPTVPGRTFQWATQEPLLLARLARPLKPVRARGYRTGLDQTFLRVHGYGGSP